MKTTAPVRPLKLADYLAAEQDFVALTQQYPDILAVYRAGTYTTPGISDLDFVLCLQNRLNQPLDIEEKLSSTLQRLIGHGSILKVPEEQVTQINVMDELPLQHLVGNEYAIAQFAATEFTICRILDWLPERLFTFNRVIHAEAVDHVRGLQLLKSFTVSLKLVQGLIGTREYEPLFELIAAARTQWVKHRVGPQEFAVLAAETLAAGGRALDQCAEWAREQGYITVNQEYLPETLTFAIPHGPVWRFGATTSVQSDHLIIPWGVAAFLAAQAQSTVGFISTKVGDSFSEPIGSNAYHMADPLFATIRQRMQFVNAVADFFRANNLKSGLLKYGWYLQE